VRDSTECLPQVTNMPQSLSGRFANDSFGVADGSEAGDRDTRQVTKKERQPT
jgi:hypothetical protein